ncbi:oxidoreductase [Rhodococcus sp. BP-252]|uniref:Ferredoxin n=1 Tax=Rhodococcoides kyotonense TaxID=398843 RepID=A0A177Y7Q8_9NOCA|nr:MULTISPECIES: PDR/VanB family oxidoreductase [Rhodococcus]MBY6411997.1 oxidoreductase [Rhodococcus sp. BP-320]MBY6416375.1 oxidoreductase [Rhodococcus sp. BP-321]MBY6420819.1 oxidoreductase [Rhodococcus sp. BP-324]MBY6426399.1 oxidoreductase [Rhodococcus sp. BP-323]MBY6431398.1 oxidoreductase [Rhodococcus sp. BP-322]
MNVALPVPDAIPGDLYGRRERDPLLRVLERLMNAHMQSLRLWHRKDVVGEQNDRRMSVVVVGRTVEAHDENVVGFVLAGAGELPSWRAGAHIDVELPSGRLRQYSLCGDPADSTTYRIAVRRIPDGDGGSIEMHDEVSVGTQLTIRGPRNAFAFAVPGHGSDADHLHFVAGGIGITPILPMARLAQRLGVDFSMVYTGRSEDSLPFLDDVRSFGDRVSIRTDDVDGIPSAQTLLEGSTPASAIYACGPMPMIDSLHRGVHPESEFHFERFSAPPIVNGVPFTVVLNRTGERITVPADKSILDAVKPFRPDVAYSCRQGFCGTCRVPVEGRPDGMLICTERTEGEEVTLHM